MPLPEKNTVFFVQSPEKTRLMIGLSWEPRQLTAGEKRKTIFYSGSGFVTSLLIYLPAKIISILAYTLSFGRTKIEMTKPEGISSEVIQSSTFKDKKADIGHSREDTYNQYDLDLCCYVFDKNNAFAFAIEPDNSDLLNAPDSSLYHSGEDFTGQGVYDDETIHIDLKKLNPANKTFVIVIKSDNKFDFASLDNVPKLRIVDNKTESKLLSVEIPIRDSSALGKYNYLAFKLIRIDNTWKFEYLNKFLGAQDVWQNTLQDYIQ